MSDRDKEAVEDKTTASAIFDAGMQRIEALAKRAEQAEPPESDPDEIEARALLDSFDGRIAEIEQRIDRVLARLNAE